MKEGGYAHDIVIRDQLPGNYPRGLGAADHGLEPHSSGQGADVLGWALQWTQGPADCDHLTDGCLLHPIDVLCALSIKPLCPDLANIECACVAGKLIIKEGRGMANSPTTSRICVFASWVSHRSFIQVQAL